MKIVPTGVEESHWQGIAGVTGVRPEHRNQGTETMEQERSRSGHPTQPHSGAPSEGRCRLTF